MTHRAGSTDHSDGCINSASFIIERRGGGCRLNLVFDTVSGGIRGLTKVRLEADSRCPGFPPDLHGIYESEPGHGPWWYTGPHHVQKPRATAACMHLVTVTFADVPVNLIKRVAPGADQKLTVNLANLSLSGTLASVGDPDATCVAAGECASGHTVGTGGWCRPPNREWVQWSISTDPKDDARYTLTPETVNDQTTGLTWQRVLPWSSYTWEGAKRSCGALDVAGGGWRLPTLAELRSIVDRSRPSPSINTTAFPNTPPGPFWSVSLLAASPAPPGGDPPWVVSFYEGASYPDPGGHPMDNFPSVRCVR